MCTVSSGQGLTVSDLLDLLTEPSEGMMMLPSRPMDQVYPNLFIGDKQSAGSTCITNPAKISHVLNVAAGPDDRFHVQSRVSVFDKTGIVLKCIEADDSEDFSIKDMFEETNEFIECGLADGGKVLVHCKEGASRSATVVLAFLMVKRKIPLPEAVKEVRKHREICPNDSFLSQLIDVYQQLQSSGHFEEK